MTRTCGCDAHGCRHAAFAHAELGQPGGLVSMASEEKWLSLADEMLLANPLAAARRCVHGGDITRPLTLPGGSESASYDRDTHCSSRRFRSEPRAASLRLDWCLQLESHARLGALRLPEPFIVQGQSVNYRATGCIDDGAGEASRGQHVRGGGRGRSDRTRQCLRREATPFPGSPPLLAAASNWSATQRHQAAYSCS
jgi:hypothetical protein